MKNCFLSLYCKDISAFVLVMFLYNFGFAQNVGIGTMSPSSKLEVVGSIKSTTPEYGLMHTDGTTSISTYIGAGAGWIGTTSNHPLWLYTNDSSYPWMVIEPDGKIGIGTSTPSALFEVNGDTKINGRISNLTDPVDAQDAATKAYVDLLGWVTVADTVSTGKYVGIGTSSPDAKLHIVGNQKIEGRLELLKSVGDSSVFIGANAGINDDGGNENTFIGHSAGQSNTTGFFNTGIGSGALQRGTTGSYNTATGSGALLNNTTGGGNTATGTGALDSNSTGWFNTAIGLTALFNNTTGGDNTAIGVDALYENTSGTRNTAVGVQALRTNSTGYDNTANGHGALYSNTTGILNTATGKNALYTNTSGQINTASGIFALEFNTTGDANTAHGASSLRFNSTGKYNTANGAGALNANNMGNYNTASGIWALGKNTTGSRNTAVGDSSLYLNTTGNHNSAIGDSSLLSNTTGSGNTGLGSGADVSSNNFVNATAIGYKALVDASNKVRIGNATVTVIEGQVPFTSTSDRRLKEDISPVQLGLDFINDLNPVQYHRINNENDDLEMGIIAQELLEVLEKHGAVQSGMVSHTDGQYMSVRYNDLIAPLIKAVQELSAENDALKADNIHFRSELNRLDKLEASLASISSMLSIKTPPVE